MEIGIVQIGIIMFLSGFTFGAVFILFLTKEK
jgi:hypothetical protein